MAVPGGQGIIVGPERRGREVVSVAEVTPGGICPVVADGNRIRHLVAGNDDGVAVNLGIGPIEGFVLARDDEALKLGRRRSRRGALAHVG